jgi:hypothetical protein
MNYIVTPSTPLNLSSSVDTSQYAQENVFISCTGGACTVNLQAQSNYKGSPNIYVLANPGAATTVNFGGGDNIFTGGASATSFTVAAGTSAILKPAGNGLWVAK